ncbi:MAG: hypothetical protein PHH21_01210 [Candidatus Pacebacteria bacterium]|nr:hypothetical protein [Candidatus Paceibacterota bacterium]
MTKKTIFILLIASLCLPVSFYFANAYSSKPPVGHSWSEMECSEALCVTSDNKVGIGTYNPTEKLEVVGNISASGSICDAAGYCLSDLSVFK